MTDQHRLPKASSDPLLPLHSQQNQQQQLLLPARTMSQQQIQRQPRHKQRRLRPRRASSLGHAVIQRPSQQHSQQQPLLDVGRIHSGSTVAGFVVGTIFEATVMGLLAVLDYHETSSVDFPLFCAILALCIILWWTGICQVVLFHMDHLLSEHNNILMGHSAVHSADAKITLYGHFNGGLAMGMALECLVLQYVLRRQSQPPNDFEFDGPSFNNDGPLLGLVSGIFVLGCVGLTLVRAYGTATIAATHKGWAVPKKGYRKLSANLDSSMV